MYLDLTPRAEQAASLPGRWAPGEAGARWCRLVSVGIDSALAWVRAELALGSGGAGGGSPRPGKSCQAVTEGDTASGVCLVPCLLPITPSLGSFGVIAIAVAEPWM